VSNIDIPEFAQSAMTITSAVTTAALWTDRPPQWSICLLCLRHRWMTAVASARNEVLPKVRNY